MMGIVVEVVIIIIVIVDVVVDIGAIGIDVEDIGGGVIDGKVMMLMATMLCCCQFSDV